MDEIQIEHLRDVFKRLKVDMELIEANFTSNPYIATAAMADLEIGLPVFALHYTNGTMNDLVRHQPMMPYEEACETLRRAYKAAGVRFSDTGV
jgi:hypothetical protein